MLIRSRASKGTSKPKEKGEEKPEEELMGNVSLLRGWQQHPYGHCHYLL